MKSMQHLAFLFLSFVITSAWAEKKEMPQSLDGSTRVDAEEIFELAEELDDLVIIDSRKPSDHAKGHIETSINLTDTKTNAESLAKLLSSKSTNVVFYCNGPKCSRSYAASKNAIELGYSNVYWFRGGWAEWLDKGFPVAK